MVSFSNKATKPAINSYTAARLQLLRRDLAVGFGSMGRDREPREDEMLWFHTSENGGYASDQFIDCDVNRCKLEVTWSGQVRSKCFIAFCGLIQPNVSKPATITRMLLRQNVKPLRPHYTR